MGDWGQSTDGIFDLGGPSRSAQDWEAEDFEKSFKVINYASFNTFTWQGNLNMACKWNLWCEILQSNPPKIMNRFLSMEIGTADAPPKIAASVWKATLGDKFWPLTTVKICKKFSHVLLQCYLISEFWKLSYVDGCLMITSNKQMSLGQMAEERKKVLLLILGHITSGDESQLYFVKDRWFSTFLLCVFSLWKV